MKINTTDTGQLFVTIPKYKIHYEITSDSSTLQNF